jgi:Lar family restriction alleviation protein
MTNGEKFKTADERSKAFGNYCNSQSCGCNKCPLNKFAGDMCRFAWLDLEYKEKPKPCPFCGHTEVDIVLSGCHGGFDACCKDCGATIIAESKTMVIEKWNRRVYEQK